MHRNILGLLVAVLMAGCVYLDSWEGVNKSWVGQPISKYAEVNGPADQTWTRPEDGKTIYKYHLKKLDPSCIHYWIVDEQGIIVDFYYEGYCRPIG